MCVWNIPSWPDSQVAIDGIDRWLVHEQKMTAPISSGRRPACSSAALGRVQRDLLQRRGGVHPRLDAGLVADLLGRHRRPAVGGVADEIVVGAEDLTLDGGQRLDLRQHRELLAHVDRPGRAGSAAW